jgi:VCBS repeat-containing protein
MASRGKYDLGRVSEDKHLLGDVLTNGGGGIRKKVGELGGSTSPTVPGTSQYGAMITWKADGTFDYNPTNSEILQELDNGESQIDSFTYTLVTTGGKAETVTAFITVWGTNDAPVAQADLSSGDEGKVQVIDVLGNDTDPDAERLSISKTTNGSYGTVVVVNGKIQYTPTDEDWFGTDEFTYTVSDGTVDGNTVTVKLTVNNVDDIPAAVVDTISVNEDDTVNFDSRSNDKDVDAGPMTVATVSAAAHGTVTLEANGTITYKPNPDYNGTDSFTYTLNGGSQATVTINVRPVDDAPTAVDDAAQMAEDSGTISINVRANDIDIDAGPMEVASVGPAVHGTAVLKENGTIGYTPEKDFFGSDTFTYMLNGGRLATVTVEVGSVDDAPVPVTATISTNEDQEATGNLAATDAADENQTLAFTLETQASHGTVSIDAKGAYSYAPASDFSGTDTFTYTVSDWVNTVEQTVTVTVKPVNDAPTGEVGLASSVSSKVTETSRLLDASDVINPATQFFNPENNHIYEYVNTPVTWQDGLLNANESSLAGVSGHLVTITTQTEQTFLEMHFPEGMWLSWIAASDALQEGNWTWMAGPEQGQPLQYANWDEDLGGSYSSQPDGGASENYAAIGGLTVSSNYGVDTPFKWVDGPSVGPQQGSGYIIEYEGQVTVAKQAVTTRLSADTFQISDADGMDGSFSFQWQTQTAGSWVNIAGANQQTYEFESQEWTGSIRAVVSYTDLEGSYETVISSPYTKTEPEPPHPRELTVADIKDPLMQFFNPDNNHIYEFVNTPVSWQEAKTLAASKSLSGAQGHLVAIMSADENDFLVSHMDVITRGYDGNEAWIAASDADQEGAWKWVAGPDNGSLLSSGFTDWGYSFGPDLANGVVWPHNRWDSADYGALTTTYNVSGEWFNMDGNTPMSFIIEYEFIV